MELVVEVVVLTKVMDSPLVRVTVSRAMEATTRAPTTALALTVKEDMAAMASPSQVDADSVTLNVFSCIFKFHLTFSRVLSFLRRI